MKFYVLAGGRSTRMGRNKAIVEIHGMSMIEHVIKAIPAPQEDIRIITDIPKTYDFLPYGKLQDIYPGLGPISGIHSGLTDSDEEANFFLACDLPNVNSTVIRSLLEIYKNQDVFGFHSARGIEPLCTIYTRRCLPVIEKQIESRNYSLQKLLQHVKSEFIKIEDDTILKNINTPNDLSSL